jgi:hypothetical protein
VRRGFDLEKNASKVVVWKPRLHFQVEQIRGTSAKLRYNFRETCSYHAAAPGLASPGFTDSSASAAILVSRDKIDSLSQKQLLPEHGGRAHSPFEVKDKRESGTNIEAYYQSR